MKRPLFCVAMAYALGEVVCLYTKTVAQGSIAAVMLLCCVFFFARKTKKWKCALFSMLAFLAGIGRAFFCIPEDIRMQVHAGDGLLAAEEADYDVYVFGGETIAGEEPEAGEEAIAGEQLSGNGTGAVYGMITGKQGDDTPILQVYDSTCSELKKGDLILLRGVEAQYPISSFVRVTGTVSLFSFPTNPGGFCTRTYYMARNINAYMYVEMMQAEGTGTIDKKVPFQSVYQGYYRMKENLYQLRAFLKSRFYDVLPEDMASLYTGILLGDKSGIGEDIKKRYQLGGIAHILAISGLHITLIGGFLYKLLRRLHLPFVPAGCLAIIFVLLYGIMSGFSLATLRAFYMLVICMAAEWRGRNYDMHTSMAIALSFMLVVQPVRILDAGVRLSYMAIAGVMLSNYIMRSLNKKASFRRFKKRKKTRFVILRACIVSFSMYGMMAGVLADVYYELPLYSGLLNLIVIPLMPVVVVSGFLGVLVSIVSVPVGTWLFYPGVLVLKGYDCLCRMTLMLPCSTLHTGSVSDLQLLLYYGGILLVACLLRVDVQKRIRTFIYKRTGMFLRQRGRFACGMLCVVAVVLVEVPFQLSICLDRRKECVCFLDVGQGDGILLRTGDGCNMVIDGGSSSKKKVGEYTLLPALKSQGMAEVDYWFITHTDDDHMSGLCEILALGPYAQIRIRNIVVSKYIIRDVVWDNLCALAKENDVQILVMDAGDQIKGGGFVLTCVHPDMQYEPADKNAASLALSYHSDKFDLLFTGDMDAEGIRYMQMQHGDMLANRYDCIKIPHHGSRYSYDEWMYGLADYMVISCGKGNRYGHPHAEVVEGIFAAGGIIVRTDEWGAIVMR